MKAKFEGTCRVCTGHIAVGDEIRWSRAEGARHADKTDCYEILDMKAEQAAELRFEQGTQAHTMGLGYMIREQGFDSL